jgi:CubicO group peptidase (beta-lactamase class C family)
MVRNKLVSRTPGKPNPFTEDFKNRAQELMRHFKVPGLSIAIVNGDQTFFDNYGYSDVDKKIKTSSDTLYYGASTTKSFTAAALMMLIEDSAHTPKPITLQTKISSLIPEDFVLQDEYATHHATLEDALTHRLGLNHHEGSYGTRDYTVKEVVQSLRYLSMHSELRVRFQYLNLGYMVLQHVIQESTGMWIGDFHQRRIWDPLGMDNTYIRLRDAQNAAAHNGKDLANGYSWDLISRTLNKQTLGDTLLVGQGGIITSVRDYAKYLRAMIFQTLPLSDSLQTELIKPRIFSYDTAPMPYDSYIGYALGWGVTNYKGNTLVTHSGGINGFAARLAFMPTQKWGIAILCNADMLGSSCIDTLFVHLMDDFLHVPQAERVDLVPACDAAFAQIKDMYLHSRRDLFPDLPAKIVPLAFPLEAYAGTYSHPAYRTFTFEVIKPREGLPVKESTKQVLHAKTERLVNFLIDLEHVSGEYFVGYINCEVPSAIALSALKAQFCTDVKGKVVRLGIESEVMIGSHETLWFERVL